MYVCFSLSLYISQACSLSFLVLFVLGFVDRRIEAGVNGSPQQEHHQQQQQSQQNHPLTIFYEGKMCVSDVTELQVYLYLLTFLF